MPLGKKGFQKGHGGSVTKQARALAAEVRSKVPASLMVDWHTAILMGFDPELVLDDDADEGFRVVWLEHGGAKPSPERKDASMKWLADRGHGQAPQMIALETSLRAGGELGAGAGIVGVLPAFTVLELRDVLRRAELGATDGAPALIDAHSTEIADAPADMPAPSTGDTGAPMG